MEYVILGLLMLQINTLYSIKKAFEQGISMFYSSSLGSLQTAVKRLEDKGYISSVNTVENGRAKKVLSISPQGETAFFEWLHQPLESNNLEVSFLSRLYFLGLLPQKSQKIVRLQAMLADVHASHQMLKHADEGLRHLDIPSGYKPIFYFQHKVLHYGIDTHAYAIEWIEGLIEEIEANED